MPLTVYSSQSKARTRSTLSTDRSGKLTSRAPEHSTIPEETESEVRTKATSSVGPADTEAAHADMQPGQIDTETNVVVEVENTESTEKNEDNESNKQGGLWYKDTTEDDGEKQMTGEGEEGAGEEGAGEEIGENKEEAEQENKAEEQLDNLNANNNNNEQDGEGGEKEENPEGTEQAESGIHRISC